MLSQLLARYYYKEVMRIVRSNHDVSYSTMEIFITFPVRYLQNTCEWLVRNGYLASKKAGIGNFKLFNCTPLGAFMIDAIDETLAGMEEIQQSES